MPGILSDGLKQFVMMLHQTGSLVEVGGHFVVQTEKDQAGLTTFGPYELFYPGIYSATFDIETNSTTATKESIICGWAEVVASKEQHIIEKTNLYLNRLCPGADKVALSFEIQEPTEIEFRVYSSGKAALKVATNVSIDKLSDKGYFPLFRTCSPYVDAFFRENLQHFRFIYENGGDVTITEQGTLVTCRGVSFYVRALEDFQLVNEIFFSNEYSCELKHKAVAIDIGMNVGLTSLYLASNPNIVEVHSFEPFQAPFNRALENFDLNPSLRQKIFAKNVGISDREELLTVLSEAQSTIGTSIKGSKTGTEEQISIQNASETIGNVISRAKKQNLEVILKIDCEGSEFSVFESLLRNGLIGEIRVFMIEWHKWWSADKSQKDIVEPLLDNEFVVFDHTTPGNIYAGMLFAVRMT